MTGDQEGVDLVNKYFAEINKVDSRLVQKAELSVVGCGVSLTKDDLEQIKENVREALEGGKHD